MAKISDFETTSPYEAEYIEVDEIVGKPIIIKDVTPFENNKGKGVHVLVVLDGKEYRICTHGVVLTDRLSRAEILEALKGGESIECKIVKVSSSTDKTRQVLKLEDA